MNPNKKIARLAGLFYFLQIPLCTFGVLYVSKALIVQGNPASTAHNILAHESLFRLSIVSALLGALDTIVTGVFLYKLFRHVNKSHAKILLACTLVVGPIAMFNELNKAIALLLLKSPTYLSAFSAIQLQTISYAFLDLHKYGIQIAGIFWGLWLFPMGYLVIQSKFIPKIIGIFLLIGFIGYMIDFITFFMFPNFGVIVSEFTFLGEVMMVFWLLIKGVKMPQIKTS